MRGVGRKYRLLPVKLNASCELLAARRGVRRVEGVRIKGIVSREDQACGRKVSLGFVWRIGV